MGRKFESSLFPNGTPAKRSQDGILELYKMMVTSSENLVSRRQGLNTYFLTVNAAVVSAAGFVLGAHLDNSTRSIGIGALTLAGAVLSGAWWALLRSFGQLNTGKFAVINEIEKHLPVAIYSAEWVALGEGKDPKKYKSFTDREIWVPRLFIAIYSIAFVVQIITLAIFIASSIGWIPGPAGSSSPSAPPTGP